MKVAKLITPEVIEISRNYTLVPDDYDFDGNLCTEVIIPSTYERFANKGDIEYGVFRTMLASKCIPIWSDLSTDERKVCIKHFKYPANIGDAYWNYVSAPEDFSNWRVLVNKSRGGLFPSKDDGVRVSRLMEAFVRLSYECTPLQTTNIYLTSKAYCIDYWMAQAPHLIFWLSSGTYAPLSIDFSTTGFAQQFAGNGYTDSLRDKLLDIINNGNY